MSKRSWASRFESSSSDEDDNVTRFLSSSSSEDLPKAHRDAKTGKWVTVYNEGEDGEFYKYEEWRASGDGTFYKYEEWKARREQVKLKHFQRNGFYLC